MTEQTGQKKAVSRKGLILLGIMGIAGLILLAFGVFSIFRVSILVGLVSMVLGFFTYFIFILIERKLKFSKRLARAIFDKLYKLETRKGNFWCSVLDGGDEFWMIGR